jgi:GDP-6-deoxy-D-talose 4-dehydrogenase
LKRIAVTGAGGFVGGYLLRVLAVRGTKAVPVARGPGGSFVQPDGEADALVHLSFPTSAAARRADPASAFRQAVAGAAQIVDVASALGARHIVVASSGKVFGAGAAPPIGDDEPPRPSTELGRLKLAVEAVVCAGAAAIGARVTLLRIFNAYGPGQPAGFFFPSLLEGLSTGRLRLGELEHGRDWVHVRDVACAITTVLEQPPAEGSRALNVGTGKATTVRQILERIRLSGRELPEIEPVAGVSRAGEAGVECGDPAGLRALGWEASTSLESGLEELLGATAGAAQASGAR